jgi:hypothetical protein
MPATTSTQIMAHQPWALDPVTSVGSMMPAPTSTSFCGTGRSVSHSQRRMEKVASGRHRIGSA